MLKPAFLFLLMCLQRLRKNYWKHLDVITYVWYQQCGLVSLGMAIWCNLLKLTISESFFCMNLKLVLISSDHLHTHSSLNFRLNVPERDTKLHSLDHLAVSRRSHATVMWAEATGTSWELGEKEYAVGPQTMSTYCRTLTRRGNWIQPSEEVIEHRHNTFHHRNR